MNLEHFIQLSGPLFEAVAESGIYSDGKSFVDSIPNSDPSKILKAFEAKRNSPSFNLKRFIESHFTSFREVRDQTIKASSMKGYIEQMWSILRRPMKAPSKWSSLISLPHSHIVPGGRFRECFYWDSYFIALGLPMTYIKEMVRNFAYLIDFLGFIPNGNRIYFASRSQPPYFSLLLKLIYERGERRFAKNFLPQLEKEYHYWINLQTASSNRYYDELETPRPEAYLREIELAKKATHPHFFQSLRAACASGWDFSSRWLADQKSFSTIQILDLLPVDLNALLYHLEDTLYLFSGNRNYKTAAEKRKKALQTLFWHDHFFYDIHLSTKKPSPSKTLAAATPLFVGAATQKQADDVAKELEQHFLLPGGFVTSLIEGEHQWDMPNGWAPLQWITIKGLLNYGHTDIALEGARRWLTLNEKLFNEKGTLLEKYNVRDCTANVARGEYPPQQGFGWTNGVAIALMELISMPMGQ
ncbi:MAG: trehalase family glycosidase [Chlamydiota bacterium]